MSALGGFAAMKTPSLRSQPDVARELGFLIMFVSNLEILFVPMMEALSSDDGMIAELIALNVDNLTAKLTILFRLAEQKAASDPLARAILDASEHVKKAVAYRNTLAHSLYVFDDATGVFELYSNLLTERRGKPKCEPLKASDVNRHSSALEAAIIKVIEVGGDRLRNPLDASPQARA